MTLGAKQFPPVVFYHRQITASSCWPSLRSGSSPSSSADGGTWSPVCGPPVVVLFLTSDPSFLNQLGFGPAGSSSRLWFQAPCPQKILLHQFPVLGGRPPWVSFLAGPVVHGEGVLPDFLSHLLLNSRGLEGRQHNFQQRQKLRVVYRIPCWWLPWEWLWCIWWRSSRSRPG